MKILLFAAVAMTALSAGTAVAGEGGGNPMNRRLSGAEHADADNESELHPRGKIMRRFLFLIVGLGLATSCGAACGHARTLPREDNIWGGYDHQPTELDVTRQEKSAGIEASHQEQQLANDDVERIYRRLMDETVPLS